MLVVDHDSFRNPKVMPNAVKWRGSYRPSGDINSASGGSASIDHVIRIKLSSRRHVWNVVLNVIFISFVSAAIYRGSSKGAAGELLVLYAVMIASIAGLIGSVFSIRAVGKRNRLGYELSVSKDGIEFHVKNLFLRWAEVDSIRAFSMIALHQTQIMIREECRSRLRHFEPRAQGGSISIGSEAIVISTNSLDISKRALYDVIQAFSHKKIQ